MLLFESAQTKELFPCLPCSSDKVYECPDYQTAGENSCFFNKNSTSIWVNYNITVVATNELGSTFSDPVDIDVVYIGEMMCALFIWGWGGWYFFLMFVWNIQGTMSSWGLNKKGIFMLSHSCSVAQWARLKLMHSVCLNPPFKLYWSHRFKTVKPENDC